MAGLNDVKQFFKDADALEAVKAFDWITGAMEVRGLIAIPGAVPARKRRSDAGQSRGVQVTGMPKVMNEVGS